ncbi:MAG: hypothetical protein KAH25_07240 [Bacteroidales bacterium]|nr:hypothetical protein [Bacteroidales bacterium]
MNKNIFLIFIALIIMPFVLFAQSNDDSNSISNDFYYLSFNSSNRSLSMTVKSTNEVVLKDITPKSASNISKTMEIMDPGFGKGTSLVLYFKEGGSIKFTLFQSHPFLFITSTVVNKSTEAVDIKKYEPLSFVIDLGKPANMLKTLGTGGLLKPNKNPGSYVFLTTVDPKTRNGVVAGWLSHEKGSGVLFSNIVDNKVWIKTQIDYGHLLLPAGKTEKLETLVIGYFEDARKGQEQFAEALAKYNNIKLRERSAVYCTWYDEKHGGAGSEASTIEISNYINKNLKPFGLGVIQIDDQWQAGGNYNGPTRGFDRTRKTPLKSTVINGDAQQVFPAPYPNGMTTTTTAIKENGLTAGIWWMPFSRNHEDPEYANRQHWFAYRQNGEPYETTWGGTSLDLTHPEVLQHIEELSKTMLDWGFNYFKMDGLWTGTVTEQVYINDGYKDDNIGNNKLLYNPYITQIEAFRNGLKAIRKATNNEVFLSGCNISQNMRSFGPAIGLVDAMRIGPDFNHDGESIRTGAIRASRLYFLNGRVWWNDPDPSMIREKGQSSADAAANGIGPLTRARLLPSFVAISNQFFLSSDWLPDLPKERLEIMKRCMASHDGVARPIDAFDKNLPAIWLASDNKTGIERHVIGLFNWKTRRKTIICSLEKAGLDTEKNYYAFDFWENKPLPETINTIKSRIPSESCQILALRAQSDHPIVVSTSQHITQGMIDILDEKWENKTLSGTSKIIGRDAYEIRIAGLNDGGNWLLEEATTDNNAVIEVLPSTEKGWLRVVIKSKDSTIANWELKFNKKF